MPDSPDKHDQQSETPDRDDRSTQIGPTATNQIAGTFPNTNIGGVDDELRQVDGVDFVDLFVGQDGRDALSPDSKLAKLREMFSEERRPLERLDDTLGAGGTVVIVGHGGRDETISAVAETLHARSAGWVVNFGELTWTELGSPQSADVLGRRRSAPDDV